MLDRLALGRFRTKHRSDVTLYKNIGLWKQWYETQCVCAELQSFIHRYIRIGSGNTTRSSRRRTPDTAHCPSAGYKWHYVTLCLSITVELCKTFDKVIITVWVRNAGDIPAMQCQRPATGKYSGCCTLYGYIAITAWFSLTIIATS